jgi:hypothetical protein
LRPAPAASGIRPGAALAVVHRDRRWWLKCLGYGAAAATGLGLPLAAGFVMESLDNSRRGYPTPLPPWSDPSLRVLTGLFALLIDFAFFVLPLLIGGALMVGVSLALLVAGPPAAPVAPWLLTSIALLTSLIVLLMFVAGASPVGRLRFAREGRIEEALDLATLRYALSPPQRGRFLRARLASLPAYLPATLIAGVTWGLASLHFPGQALVFALGVWLTMAALVYAHLVVAQLYVAAEAEVQL